jgi:Flp pilus assembly protein TadD
VQGAADGGDQMLVVGQALQGLFDDGFAGAGNAEHQTESALLTMDLEGVVNLLLLGQKRPREAVAPLEEAARNSADPELETHLAVALGKAGRSDDALKWLYRAIERRPAYARAFQELGSLLHAMRRYAEAETVLKRGLEAAPTVPELSLALGAVYIDRADSAGARLRSRAFSRSCRATPTP